MIDEDAVIACIDLVERAGAESVDIGYLHDDVPVEKAGWYAHASYRGARITVEDRASPSEAATALAVRLLTNAKCRCGKEVALDDRTNKRYCRWTRQGRKWEPGCDAPPLTVKGARRGDHAAIERALRDRAARTGS